MKITQNKYPHEWEELVAGYVLADLSSEEVIEIHKIILEHPEIVTKIDHLQEALAMLPLGLNETSPAPNLRDRIAAQAIPITVENLLNSPVDTSKESLLNDSFAPTNRSPQRKNLWQLAAIGLSSIGAIALIALGIDNYQMRQQIATDQIELQKHRQTIAMLQGADNRMISLKGMGAIPTAFGTVMIAPTEKAAMISIQNLRQIPQDNSYRLWAIVDGKKVNCAQFRPDEQGKVFVKVPLGDALKQTTALIITIEPNKDMPEPTGEMVLKGEV
ncbi:MAG: anti-sigma factor [Pseudanabaena sp. ELA748]